VHVAGLSYIILQWENGFTLQKPPKIVTWKSIRMSGMLYHNETRDCNIWNASVLIYSFNKKVQQLTDRRSRCKVSEISKAKANMQIFNNGNLSHS